MKYILTTITLLALMLALSSYYTRADQNPRLTNVRIISDKGFSAPQFSPDDTKLLFSTMKNHGIYLSDLSKNDLHVITELPESGYRATWTPDGQKIVFRHKVRRPGEIPYFVMKSIGINGTMDDLDSEIKPMNFFSAVTASKPSDPIITMNNETFKIEAHTAIDRTPVLVTTDQGNFYRPTLSPDRKKVLVHLGPEMLVYAVDGSGLIANLGIGLGGSWSPDGTKIVSFLDESTDGHQVTGSELYVVDVATQTQTKITNTPNVFEMWPDWSNNGERIAYCDGRTGEIMVADIQF